MKVKNVTTTTDRIIFEIEEERTIDLEINLKTLNNTECKYVENHLYYKIHGMRVFNPPESFQSFSSKLSISKKIKSLTFSSFNVFKKRADFIMATFIDDEEGSKLKHFDRIWQKNKICPMNYINRTKKFDGKNWLHVLIYEFQDKPIKPEDIIKIQEFLNAFK